MHTEAFEFTAPDGRLIESRFDHPAGQTRAFALFAHCFTCGKDNLAATRISRALADLGIGTVRIDFAGLGEAAESGPPEPEGFSADVADLVAAGKHMAANGRAPQLLVGHSLGGAAAIAAAGRMPSVKAVATIGAPFDVSHVLTLLGPGASQVRHGQTHEAKIGGRTICVRHGFAEDLRAQDQKERLAGLKRALLVLHSPVDQIVGIEESSAIFLSAKHPKSFVSLDKADHLLSKRGNAAYAAAVIAAWASNYIKAVATPGAAPADGVVRVEETGVGRFQVKVAAGGAVLMADEPVSVGGLASGPTPYELVSAGLGACTVMTLRLYAERKGLPLAKASVEVRHKKRAGQAPVDLFERELTLNGDLDEAQRAKLFEIADRCPVHRTLEAGAALRTSVKAAAAAPAEEEHFSEMEAIFDEEGAESVRP